MSPDNSKNRRIRFTARCMLCGRYGQSDDDGEYAANPTAYAYDTQNGIRKLETYDAQSVGHNSYAILIDCEADDKTVTELMEFAVSHEEYTAKLIACAYMDAGIVKTTGRYPRIIISVLNKNNNQQKGEIIMNEKKTYTPKPIDTSDITLPREISDLAELLSKNTHDIWAVGRINSGWTYGEKRDDENKKTPCLVEYEELPESEKEYDRNTSLETLKLIIKLGYKIVKE